MPDTLNYQINSMPKKIYILLALVLALVMSAFALWRVNKKVVAPVVTEPTVTQNQLEQPNVESVQEYSQHIEAIPGNTDEVWYNIPELGIRMKLNKEFAEDLVYRSETPAFATVYFSGKKFMVIAPSCVSGLGSLFKAKGIMKEIAKTDDFLASRMDSYIQIQDYYYGWTGPQDACWDPSIEEEVRKVFPGKYNGMGAKFVSEGVKTLQLIPKK